MSTAIYKSHLSISQRLLICLFLTLLMALPGCVHPSREVDYQDASLTSDYQSDLSDPQAKALFAYGQFRLYAAEERWTDAVAALERALTFDPHSTYLPLLLAKSYLHEKKTGDALAVLDKLIAESPENVEGLELRGDIANLENDLDAARHYYQRALMAGSESNDIKFRLAMVLERLKQHDQAASLLGEVLGKNPDFDVARLALARIYADSGQKKLALKEIRNVLQRNPSNIQAALEYGKILEAEDSEGALNFYQTFLAENPRASYIRQQMVAYYLSKQQFEPALAQLQEIRWERPDDTQVVAQIGLLQLELHNWTSAEKEFQSLLNRNVQPDRNRYYLALALAGQGHNDEAIKTLKQVSAQSEVFNQAMLQLAYLYNDQGDTASAMNILMDSLKSGTYEEATYYYLVALLGDSGSLSEAVNYAREAVSKYPKDERLLYQLGVLYEKQGLRAEAVQVMEQLLILNQDHADALNFLAYQQAEEERDLELALVRAKHALAVKNSGYIIDTLGWIYFKLGRYEESREQLEEAGRLYPDDPVITEHLGDLYMAMQLWDNAAKAYQKVLKLNADASGVADKLLQVEKHR